MDEQEPVRERKHGCYHCLKLMSLAFLLMGYELASFIGYLSLSIGVGTGVKILLRIFFSYDLNVTLETFCSWYTLAASTEVHLRFYRRCIFPSVRVHLRKHPSILQGFPRAVYFLLYCGAIYGLYTEYEAVHSFRPIKLHSPIPLEKRPQLHLRPSLDIFGENQNGKGNGRQDHNPSFRPLISTHTFYVYKQEDFAAEAPKEKVHTALFLMFMSYIIYSSAQILCTFLIRILKGVPFAPILPQLYATFTMMILQLLMTTFYAFPILMSLIACHMFHVDGVSTYLFTLCLALCVSMAAAQLESETPFPTQGRIAPYFYFESQYRARINVIFLILPFVAYYFFNRHRSYPLTAHDKNFGTFTFWLHVGLMHTLKSLYLTTWRPTHPIEFPPPGPQQMVGANFNIGPIIPYNNYPYPPDVFPRPQDPPAPVNNNNFQNNNNTQRATPSKPDLDKHTNIHSENSEVDAVSLTFERENENQLHQANPHKFTRNKNTITTIATTTSVSVQNWSDSKNLGTENTKETESPSAQIRPSQTQNEKDNQHQVKDDFDNDNPVNELTVAVTSNGPKNSQNMNEIEQVFQEVQNQNHHQSQNQIYFAEQEEK